MTESDNLSIDRTWLLYRDTDEGTRPFELRAHLVIVYTEKLTN